MSMKNTLSDLLYSSHLGSDYIAWKKDQDVSVGERELRGVSHSKNRKHRTLVKNKIESKLRELENARSNQEG